MTGPTGPTGAAGSAGGGGFGEGAPTTPIYVAFVMNDDMKIVSASVTNAIISTSGINRNLHFTTGAFGTLGDAAPSMRARVVRLPDTSGTTGMQITVIEEETAFYADGGGVIKIQNTFESGVIEVLVIATRTYE